MFLLNVKLPIFIKAMATGSLPERERSVELCMGENKGCLQD